MDLQNGRPWLGERIQQLVYAQGSSQSLKDGNQIIDPGFRIELTPPTNEHTIRTHSRLQLAVGYVAQMIEYMQVDSLDFYTNYLE
jgi:hypothetical protein